MTEVLPEWKNAVYFILVRPEFLGNIGSVARAMKNFGFSNLRLVDAPRNYKDAEARKMSVGAFDVLKTSTTFESFADAIADIQFVIGTSSGQQRTLPIKNLDEALELAPLQGQNKIALVFGDERNGLKTDELALCHVLAKIPTDPNFPCLNLAQSACIISYELAKKLSNSEPDLNSLEANLILSAVSDNDQLFEQIEVLLQNIEFSRTYNKALLLSELRQFYNRAKPTKRESELLRGVLRKLNQSYK